MKLKNALAAAGIATATLLTSGCLSVAGDIALDRQAQATGSMKVTLNKQVASLAGISSAEDLNSQVRNGGDNVPADAPIAVSETDTDYVMTYEFEDEVMDEDNLTAKVLDGGHVQFTYVNEGVGKDDSGLLGDAEIGNVTLTVNFPGEVLEYSGEGAAKVDEDTVKWSFPATRATTATATSKVTTGAGALLPFGVVTAAGTLAGAGTLLLLRRRSGTKERTAGPGAALPPPPEGAAQG